MILKVKEASIASQGSQISSEKGIPALVGDKRAVSPQPASLRRQEDVSIVSPSLEPFLSNFGLLLDEEDVQEEKEVKVIDIKDIKEIAPPKRNLSYTLELSVMLDKKKVYNTSTRSKRFYFKSFKEQAYCYASKAVNKQNKDAKCSDFKANIKIDQQKP